MNAHQKWLSFVIYQGQETTFVYSHHMGAPNSLLMDTLHFQADALHSAAPESLPMDSLHFGDPEEDTLRLGDLHSLLVDNHHAGGPDNFPVDMPQAVALLAGGPSPAFVLPGPPTDGLRVTDMQLSFLRHSTHTVSRSNVG